jgi:hypothetical protein
MEKHSSQLFHYDKEKTRLGYNKLDYKFSDSIIKNNCIEKVINAMQRNLIDVGIDIQKPWEELLLDENHYQIEYLFVGKINNKNGFIHDSEIGINIFEETRFGQENFNSKDLLNLTLIIEK